MTSLKTDYKEKWVLITGGLGFIGSNLAIRLVEHGANVTLYSRKTDKVRNVKEVISNVKIVQGDIRDSELLRELLSKTDYVFHLAAQTSNITSMEDPFLDLDVNVRPTLSILEACRKDNPEAVIVSVGSVTQIGPASTPVVDESHFPLPGTIYDSHKLLIEHYFRIYHRAFGLRTVFLRLPSVYGERQEVTSKRTGIVNSFIWKALNGETILVFGDGKFLRDYIYVGDVVEALLYSALAPSAAGEAFQVATGRGTPFIDMVKTVISTVERLTGLRAKYECVKWPSEWKMVDAGSFVGSYEKLNKFTGWRPRTSLEEGIDLTTRFYIDRRDEYAFPEQV